MREVLKLGLNDLRLVARDRVSFVWLLAFPLAMMALLGFAMGGRSGDERARLTVVDHDVGWLSRAFVGELRDEQIDLVELSPEEAAAAKDKVRTLVIPEGFTEQVLAGEQQTLRLEKDPDSSRSFGMAAEMNVVRAIGRTLARLVEMKELATGGSPLSEVDAKREFEALGERPALVGLEVSSAGAGHPVPSGFAQSVPGTLTMMVLMMTVIYGGVFLAMERRTGMLRRQSVLPMTRSRIIAGKLAGRLILAGLQAVVLLAAARFLYGLDLGGSPAGLVLVLASLGVAVTGLSVLCGAVLRTPDQAAAVGWISSMILAALGGCWWPAEVMPRWMWTLAHALPTAWAMDGFHAVISFGRGVEGVLLPSAVLFAFGALFSAVGIRFLRFD